MKILFLNPPFKSEHGRFSREQRSPAITKGGTFYYPMWLCYAAGVAEADGFEVKIIDAPAKRLTRKEVLSEVKNYAPGLMVIDTSTPSIENDVGIAEELKAAIGAFVILVGTHPSALPAETLGISQTVDAIARKEYEYTVLTLARALQDSGEGAITPELLREIAGLSFRQGDKIIHNPDRAYIENLDALPFLAEIYHRHLDIRDYFYTMAQFPQVAIYSGRGCPFRCAYCVYPQVMHGHNYRQRSIPNLVAEFKYIEQQMPEVREIFIEDDTFTVDKIRVLEFSRLYQDENLSISWIANSRADIDLETLQALKACNCRILCVGFESGDQGVLDGMQKGLKVEKARQFMKDAKKAGLLVHGCFIVGNKGESRETLETTLQYAKELCPDTAQFFPLMVYPGTKAYRWAQENRFLLSNDFKDWNTPEGLHNCVVSRPGLSNEDLVDFCDRARKEFYLRPSYILYRLGRLCVHPLEDGPRMWISLKQFLKFLLRGTDKKKRHASGPAVN
ncbi:MAG: radical SAM protein [Planctomycetes bacterium]|nr:radical SAM protein [Planctomycetota bacterium]